MNQSLTHSNVFTNRLLTSWIRLVLSIRSRWLWMRSSRSRWMKCMLSWWVARRASKYLLRLRRYSSKTCRKRSSSVIYRFRGQSCHQSISRSQVQVKIWTEKSLHLKRRNRPHKTCQRNHPLNRSPLPNLNHHLKVNKKNRKTALSSPRKIRIDLI